MTGEPILAINPIDIPKCCECGGYDGLGRWWADDDLGESGWWCRACDLDLQPPLEIDGQQEMDLGDAGALEGEMV